MLEDQLDDQHSVGSRASEMFEISCQHSVLLYYLVQGSSLRKSSTVLVLARDGGRNY